MMTKAATPPSPDTLTDPWSGARPSWVRVPGTRADRTRAAGAPQQPLAWQHLPDPADRALVAACACQVVADAPAIGFAFAARVLEQLRARGAAAPTAEEREQLRRIEMVLSRNVADFPDLLLRVRALRAEARV